MAGKQTNRKNHRSRSDDAKVPYYITGDGVAYAVADEILRSQAVKEQLEDIAKIREASAHSG